MNVPDVAVCGRGCAERPALELFAASARATIRYADHAAWTTATAIARAISAHEALTRDACHHVGVAVVSDHGPCDTMAQVQANASDGFSSPLRYAAASPGTLAGVACIALGLRGPTLNFGMPPAAGLPVALLMCRAWLARGTARAVVMASFVARAGGTGSARAVLLMPVSGSHAIRPLDSESFDWLAQVEH